MPTPDLASLKIHDSARSRGSGGKFLRYFAAAIGVLLLIAGAVFALKSRAPVVEVAVAQGAGDPAQQTLLNASGYVTPRRRATVAAKITGRVTGVFFDEGNKVKEGQLLTTLDDSDAKRALDSAVADRDSAKAAIRDYEVQLRYAEIQLHRSQELTAAKVSSQDQLDNAMTAADSLKAKIVLAKQQVNSSDARIREAQQAVDNCTIRAPFSGIIVSKDAQVGEMVSPISAGGGFTRTGIATIVDMNSNEVEVDVNEAYIARVQPRQRVDSVLDAYPDWKIPSHVRTVIPTADRQKATVKVRISFDKLDPRILPDMGVKVSFYGEEEEKKNAAKKKEEGPKPVAIVAKSAVRSSGDSAHVFLLKNGKVERRGVRLGHDRGSDVEVMAGVNPGDSLVTRGPENLRDGDTVRVNQAQ
jgi:RND family efflux transporter MFP subunit